MHAYSWQVEIDVLSCMHAFLEYWGDLYTLICSINLMRLATPWLHVLTRIYSTALWNLWCHSFILHITYGPYYNSDWIRQLDCNNIFQILNFHLYKFKGHGQFFLKHLLHTSPLWLNLYLYMSQVRLNWNYYIPLAHTTFVCGVHDFTIWSVTTKLC